MIPVLVFLSFLAGIFVSAPLLRLLPGNRKRRDFLVIWNGMTVDSGSAKVVPEGLQMRGVIYPAGVIYTVQLADNIFLNLSGIDNVALADHKTLEFARRTIALRALFRSGGEWLRWLQLAACIVPILVTMLLWQAFGSVQNSVNQLSANVLAIKAITDKPLVTAPAK